MKRRIVIVCAVLMLSVFGTRAQEKPAATKPAPDPPKVEQIADQDQQTYILLLYRADVQRQDIATLQKELDSTNADVSRLVARLQKPGYDLTRDPQSGRLVLVAKTEPKKEPKKEPPK